MTRHTTALVGILALSLAMVNVGTDHDTPEFAVASIKQWWRRMGKKVYPDAK